MKGERSSNISSSNNNNRAAPATDTGYSSGSGTSYSSHSPAIRTPRDCPVGWPYAPQTSTSSYPSQGGSNDHGGGDATRHHHHVPPPPQSLARGQISNLSSSQSTRQISGIASCLPTSRFINKNSGPSSHGGRGQQNVRVGRNPLVTLMQEEESLIANEGLVRSDGGIISYNHNSNDRMQHQNRVVPQMAAFNTRPEYHRQRSFAGFPSSRAITSHSGVGMNPPPVTTCTDPHCHCSLSINNNGDTSSSASVMPLSSRFRSNNQASPYGSQGQLVSAIDNVMAFSPQTSGPIQYRKKSQMITEHISSTCEIQHTDSSPSKIPTSINFRNKDIKNRVTKSEEPTVNLRSEDQISALNKRASWSAFPQHHLHHSVQNNYPSNSAAANDLFSGGFYKSQSIENLQRSMSYSNENLGKKPKKKGFGSIRLTPSFIRGSTNSIKEMFSNFGQSVSSNTDDANKAKKNSKLKKKKSYDVDDQDIPYTNEANIVEATVTNQPSHTKVPAEGHRRHSFGNRCQLGVANNLSKPPYLAMEGSTMEETTTRYHNQHHHLSNNNNQTLVTDLAIDGHCHLCGCDVSLHSTIGCRQTRGSNLGGRMRMLMIQDEATNSEGGSAGGRSGSSGSSSCRNSGVFTVLEEDEQIDNEIFSASRDQSNIGNNMQNSNNNNNNQPTDAYNNICYGNLNRLGYRSSNTKSSVNEQQPFKIGMEAMAAAPSSNVKILFAHPKNTSKLEATRTRDQLTRELQYQSNATAARNVSPTNDSTHANHIGERISTIATKNCVSQNSSSSIGGSSNGNNLPLTQMPNLCHRNRSHSIANCKPFPQPPPLYPQDHAHLAQQDQQLSQQDKSVKFQKSNSFKQSFRFIGNGGKSIFQKFDLKKKSSKISLGKKLSETNNTLNSNISSLASNDVDTYPEEIFTTEDATEDFLERPRRTNVASQFVSDLKRRSLRSNASSSEFLRHGSPNSSKRGFWRRGSLRGSTKSNKSNKSNKSSQSIKSAGTTTGNSHNYSSPAKLDTSFSYLAFNKRRLNSLTSSLRSAPPSEETCGDERQSIQYINVPPKLFSENITSRNVNNVVSVSHKDLQYSNVMPQSIAKKSLTFDAILPREVAQNLEEESPCLQEFDQYIIGTENVLNMVDYLPRETLDVIGEMQVSIPNEVSEENFSSKNTYLENVTKNDEVDFVGSKIASCSQSIQETKGSVHEMKEYDAKFAPRAIAAKAGTSSSSPLRVSASRKKRRVKKKTRSGNNKTRRNSNSAENCLNGEDSPDDYLSKNDAPKKRNQSNKSHNHGEFRESVHDGGRQAPGASSNKSHPEEPKQISPDTSSSWVSTNLDSSTSGVLDLNTSGVSRSEDARRIGDEFSFNNRKISEMNDNSNRVESSSDFSSEILAEARNISHELMIERKLNYDRRAASRKSSVVPASQHRDDDPSDLRQTRRVPPNLQVELPSEEPLSPSPSVVTYASPSIFLDLCTREDPPYVLPLCKQEQQPRQKTAEDVLLSTTRRKQEVSEEVNDDVTSPIYMNDMLENCIIRNGANICEDSVEAYNRVLSVSNSSRVAATTTSTTTTTSFNASRIPVSNVFFPSNMLATSMESPLTQSHKFLPTAPPLSPSAHFEASVKEPTSMRFRSLSNLSVQFTDRYRLSSNRTSSCQSVNRVGSCQSVNRVGSCQSVNRVGSCQSVNRVGSCQSVNRVGSCQSVNGLLSGYSSQSSLKSDKSQNRIFKKHCKTKISKNPKFVVESNDKFVFTEPCYENLDKNLTMNKHFFESSKMSSEPTVTQLRSGIELGPNPSVDRTLYTFFPVPSSIIPLDPDPYQYTPSREFQRAKLVEEGKVNTDNNNDRLHKNPPKRGYSGPKKASKLCFPTKNPEVESCNSNKHLLPLQQISVQKTTNADDNFGGKSTAARLEEEVIKPESCAGRPGLSVS